jgi:D-citramalate synthase
MEKKKIEIMDTTLRDGEQTSEYHFLLQKTNHCAIVVEELNIDRIEIASHAERRGISRCKRNNELG